MLKRIIIFIAVIVLLFTTFNRAQELFSNDKVLLDDEEIIVGEIVEIPGEDKIIRDNREYVSQNIALLVTEGSAKGRTIDLTSSLTPAYNEYKYEKGDELLVGYINSGENSEYFYIIGYSRTKPLIILFAIFAVLAVLIAKKKGLYSLFGMVVSVSILILFILPLIADGANPLLVSVGGMVIIVPTLFYISHGFSRKTSVAIAGTVITLSVTALIAAFFVDAANLTGIAFAEIETLLYAKEGQIDLQGIILAGILMGALGVIDDVAITQVSIVEELKNTNPKLKLKELNLRAMKVGRDHIASIINTLILVYVGGSLTTLLLFTEFPRPLTVLVNNEIVSLQIMIALIGSIGLILAIPITTSFASWAISREKVRK